MKIAIFGLGYVGLTAVACLSSQGHEIVGVDVSDEKVEAVGSGKSPITEPGLPEMIRDGVAKGLIKAMRDASAEINSCDIVIVCVGTPSAADGSHNMSYIAEVSRQIAAMIDPARSVPLTVIYRSTIRPGTTEELIRPIFEAEMKGAIDKVELVYNPEFLRESVAIKDYFNPPKIVIGTADGKPSKNLEAMNAGLKAPVFYTKYREAEITKFVDNTYHAVKVAFGNEIGRVCYQLGISAAKVHEIFVSDTKLNISPYYFRAGGAFGGSCLPKDVRALQHMGTMLGANNYLVDSLMRSNEAHKDFIFNACVTGLKPGAKVLMVGLSFKADSDDLRESPNLDLARRLLQAGYALSIYEPHIEPSKLLGQNLGYAYSNLPALRNLLVDQATAEATEYDLVIDTRSWASKLKLRTPRIFDINALA